MLEFHKKREKEEVWKKIIPEGVMKSLKCKIGPGGLEIHKRGQNMRTTRSKGLSQVRQNSAFSYMPNVKRLESDRASSTMQA